MLMEAIRIVYRLSEVGQRNFLKTYTQSPYVHQSLQNGSVGTLTIERDVSSKSEAWYCNLGDYVDLKTLTFYCDVPGKKILTVADSRNGCGGFLLQINEHGLYLEVDNVVIDDYTDILDNFISALRLRKKLQAAEAEARSNLARLPFVVKVQSFNYPDDLTLEQVNAGTFKPDFKATYEWTDLSAQALLSSLGWTQEELDFFEWPWEQLLHQYKASKSIPLPIECYSARDYAAGKIEVVWRSKRTLETCGLKTELLLVPNLKAFRELKASFEAQKQRRLEFLETQGSNYVKRLAQDGKHYEHILDREILSKFYPKGFLVKHYEGHEYRERNCPTPQEYGHLNYIQNLYPDLTAPRFHWLSIHRTELDSCVEVWAGPVLVMQTPFDFDVVFGDFTSGEFHLSEQQTPVDPLVLDSLMEIKAYTEQYYGYQPF